MEVAITTTINSEQIVITTDELNNIEEKFLKSNINLKSVDKSIVDAIEATDHLHKTNLNKLIENLHLKEFTSNDKQNRINIFNESWSVYEKLRLNYSLEGDQNNWLACLVYIIYHKITLLNKIYHLTNKTKQDDLEQQPYLYVINLLRYTNLNVIQFLKKCKKLNEILNIPNELCYRIDQLELNYNVSCVLFSKFKMIFSQVFNCFNSLYDFKSNDYIKSNELFEFTWMLFINIRAKFNQLNNDLVNSFHLLLCCLNLIYLNLQPQSNSDDFELIKYKKFLNLINLDTKTSSFIDYLCKHYDGQSLETKTINEHYFKPQLQNLIDKNLFGTRLIAPKCHLFALIDLKKRLKFKRIIFRLNKSYDSLITINNTSLKCNALNCLDLIYSFDIDERLFLNNKNQIQISNNANNLINLINSDDDLDDVEDETDSNSLLNYEIESKINNIKLCDSLQLLFNLDTNEMKLSLKNNFSLINFELVETKLTNDFRSYFLNELNGDEIQSPISKKRKLDSSSLKQIQVDYAFNLVDHLFDLVFKFYLKSLQLMFKVEQNRIGLEQFKKNKLIENETFHKSVYICCYELVYNFAQISLENSNHYDVNNTDQVIKIDKYFSLITQSFSTNLFEFPQSLHLAQLNEYDFFLIIESFVKALTQTSQLNTDSTTLLDRDMIRYLNNLEEKILESLVWNSQSTIWKKLNEIKLNENYLNSFQSSTNSNIHLLVPFPLYDDVNNSNQIQTPLTQQQSTVLNGTVSQSNNSDIIINLTPNPLTPSSNTNIFTSPAKHPTITRVVCSTIDSSNRSSLTSNKPIQILSLNNQNKKPHQRLNNLSHSLMFFFRKFYQLTNSRIRDLVDKLDMVTISLDAFNSTTSKLNEIPPNTGYQNQQLTNECQQAILKKILNIFEFSLSISTSNKQNLITDRHLDHLILCSIYVTCRLYSFKIQFNDIIKVYKHLWPVKANIYKNILIDTDKYSDLILFYNELFIKTVKHYLAQLNGNNTVLTPNFLITDNNSKKSTSPNTAFLSPIVPKLQQTTPTNLVQFSPRKLLDNVFVSPVKQNMINVQSHRNKLTFSFKDINPNKTIRLINEMIKKNEVKIKPNNINTTSNVTNTNKRIFTDISTVSLNSSNPTSVSTSQSSLKNIKIEDETDSSTIKQGSTTTMRITNINTAKATFLNSVVGSKLGFKSNTNNLVTMVVDSSSGSGNSQSNMFTSASNNLNGFTNTSAISSSLVGSNFARKLQNIQTERIN